MTDVIVLGGGRVGAVMARDLAERAKFNVTVADVSAERLRALSKRGLGTVKADLSVRDAVVKLVKDYDLAVGAVPGFMGRATLESAIQAGVDCLDISFMPEDFMALDGAARKAGVVAVADCGVAPGLSNMMVGHAAAELDSVERALIMVGGLPEVRTWPYEYKAGFSPVDVLEEYTRPARLVRGGKVVTEPALSGVELVDLPGVGTLEAFNTDGLRSLINTINAPEMREMTLRYPGHAEKMRMLRETGFFSDEPLTVNGQKVRPIDLTAKLLFPMWELRPGDRDLTVMRVEVVGRKSGNAVRHTYDLLDRFDDARGETSMSRTTGFTGAIVATMVAKGRYARKGVSPPESLGRDKKIFEEVLRELENRDVRVKHKIERVT